MNKYTLQQLLTQELEVSAGEFTSGIRFSGVRIPMIQRDYAQGREDEREIRIHFLSAIFSALSLNESLELDFVYGSVREQDSGKLFIPLDGQQRLTTLFLLYWYIAQRELEDCALMDLCAALSTFSYDTRSTSRDFCLALTSLPKTIFAVKPSLAIRNTSWFYSAFDKDPTVKAMLNMLDAIHGFYGPASQSLFSRMGNLKFYILPLDGFGLTDELYIKMNARGKPLTDFENFKADLINWITDKDNPESDMFRKKVTYRGRLMDHAMALSLKLDNDWTGFFWKFTKNADDENKKLVDGPFLRFINRFALNRLIVESQLTQDALEKSDGFNHFYGGDQKGQAPRYVNFQHYKRTVASHDALMDMEHTLDLVTAYYAEISEILPPPWKISDLWHFFGPEASQTQRILLLGLCGFLQAGDFNMVAFKRWIRVVWNIIINPDIRSVPAMITAMKLVNELAPQARSIYEFLGSTASAYLEEKYRYTELAEERSKAALINDNPEWETTLTAGERHPLFQGSVGFLLEGNPDIPAFEARLRLAAGLFGESGAQRDYAVDHVLMRALISSIRLGHELESLKMEDSQDNWALLLRRNVPARKIIAGFCDADDAAQLRTTILTAIVASSAISWQNAGADTGRIRNVHRQLYQPADFHRWMQERNAVDLVRREEHFYIKRYRAWYDMVMLDTLRNGLIAELIERFGLTTANRCGTTNFFSGYRVELEKIENTYVITLEFDQIRLLQAGLKRNKNVIEPGASPFGENNGDAYWHIVKFYDYNNVTTMEQGEELICQIGCEVFDRSEPGSLYNMISLTRMDENEP